MAKRKVTTNFMEILLQKMIGEQIIIKDKIYNIDSIVYQPFTKEIYIQSGSDGYILSLDYNYEFFMDKPKNRIKINKGKLPKSV